MNEAAERRQCVKHDRICMAKFGRNEPCGEQCKGMRKPTKELEYKAHSIWRNKDGEARVDVVIFPNREHVYDFNSRSLGITLDKKELRDFLKEYNFELLEYNKDFEYEIDFFRGKKLEHLEDLVKAQEAEILRLRTERDEARAELGKLTKAQRDLEDITGEAITLKSWNKICAGEMHDIWFNAIHAEPEERSETLERLKEEAKEIMETAKEKGVKPSEVWE